MCLSPHFYSLDKKFKAIKVELGSDQLHHLHSLNIKKATANLLQGIDEFAVVHRRRVDDLLNELPVTVGIGRGDVQEYLQVLHPVGQGHHLLGG